MKKVFIENIIIDIQHKFMKFFKITKTFKQLHPSQPNENLAKHGQN